MKVSLCLLIFGLLSHLPKLEDTRNGERKLVYAPHCYPLFIDLAGDAYNQQARDNLALWEATKDVELKRHDSPMLIGEFGLSPSIPGFDEYIQDHNAMADRMQASWAYWSNDLGGWSPLDGNQNETPILQELIRTFPQAIAGRLLDFDFDSETKIFNLDYVSNTNISMPTEIFVPQRFYEAGWDLSVEGTDNWTQEWDAARQILKLTVNDNNAEVSVQIQPD